jgi:hypothetical protein
MTKKIEIIIDKDGSMEVKTSGFAGMACLDTIKELAARSGLDLKAEKIHAQPDGGLEVGRKASY